VARDCLRHYRRKKIEQALRESEEKYRTVVEGSLAGFYVIQDNIFRFVNQRACEITGYPYDEFVDRLSPFDVIHPDDKPKIEKSLQSRLSGEKDYVEYDVRVIRRDGQIITVKVFGSVMNYNGRRAVSGTFIDITREKTLESQLCQAQKMEAVGQLAGGIAHDFNNILTALDGYASLLQMRINEADPLMAYVNQILSASQKATTLTKRLLSFTRQQPKNLQAIGINKIIRGTEDLLKRLLTEDIHLETRLARDDLMIRADPIQMDQILFNLVSNARDAMPRGGGLTIETGQALLDNNFLLTHGFGEPGRYALLSISDTGAGMDEITRKKIFEPFFTTKEKGTGLGLATVYGIVKQHDGYITVYSDQNVGTTFQVYFPLIETVM
jgi:two-component system cell cycle sensor histidine kinase/response regulator CckA